jgi:hypothetical protein
VLHDGLYIANGFHVVALLRLDSLELQVLPHLLAEDVPSALTVVA